MLSSIGLATLLVHNHRSNQVVKTSQPSSSQKTVSLPKSNNAAQQKLTPFLEKLTAYSPKLICTDGDPGTGFPSDNTTPTFAVYEYVNTEAGLKDSLVSNAKDLGFNLLTDTAHISDLQTGNNIGVGENGPIESYDSQNDYLTSDTAHSFQKPEMNVKVLRGGHIDLSCNNSPYKYGTAVYPTTDKPILVVNLELYSAN